MSGLHGICMDLMSRERKLFQQFKMKQYFLQGNLRVIGSYRKPNIHQFNQSYKTGSASQTQTCSHMYGIHYFPKKDCKI